MRGGLRDKDNSVESPLGLISKIPSVLILLGTFGFPGKGLRSQSQGSSLPLGEVHWVREAGPGPLFFSCTCVETSLLSCSARTLCLRADLKQSLKEDVAPELFPSLPRRISLEIYSLRLGG